MFNIQEAGLQRVLVTGATGFVGRAVCDALHKEGIQVVGTVRRSAQMAVLQPDIQPVVIGDLGPDTEWKTALTNVDAVIHTAAHVHIMRQDDSGQLDLFQKVNTEGTRQLAQSAQALGVKRFVFISTVKVCGEGQAYSPFTKHAGSAVYDDDSPCLPQNAYAQTKLEAEQLLWAMQSKMEMVVLRPPLVYGPGVGGNFLKLLHLIDSGLPVPLKSVKNQRSMVYLGNLISGLLAVLFHKDAPGRTFFISDGQEISTPDLIVLLSKLLNRSVRLFPFPLPLLWGGGQLVERLRFGPLLDSLVVDSSAIRDHLNWSPPYTLNEGLSEAVNWYIKTKSNGA